MAELLFNSFLAGLLAAPLVALFATWMRQGRALAALFQAIVLVAGGASATVVLVSDIRIAVDVYWLSPFPFTLALDRLSAFFLLIICGAALPVIVFSTSYFERHYTHARQRWFWALLPLFVLSMVLVVTAGTAFAFLFGWELMTLFSTALVMIDGCEGERKRNLFIYLLMMHAGAAAVFGAFLGFLPHAAALDFASLRASAPMLSTGARAAIFVLAFIGFGAKAGIVPLHLWLPKAHPIAPSPVSALMSGVMLKTAIYGFIRLTFDLLGGSPPIWWGYLTLAAGAISALLGVLYALHERDLKRLLAYSSVENIGIIFLGLGASMVFLSQQAPAWAALALAGSLFHALNHALFKTLLFLGAGAISDATHTLEIERLGGLFRRMRPTATVMLVACCSIAGLPLFNGFAGEWIAFRSFIAGGELSTPSAAIVMPLMAGVLALVGGLAASCFAQLFSVAFLGRPRSAEAAQAEEVPLTMQSGMAILAIVCVAIGIAPSALFGTISHLAQQLIPGATEVASAGSLLTLMPWLALFVTAAAAVCIAIPRIRRVTPTWACGMHGLDSRMQYTATSLSKPLRKVFAMAYQPERAVKILPADQPCFPASISYRSVRTTSFERALYRPAIDSIVNTARRLRLMQTGNIQVYLLYMFLALVAALICMRFA
jgi:hydrogenase-4 component B